MSSQAEQRYFSKLACQRGDLEIDSTQRPFASRERTEEAQIASNESPQGHNCPIDASMRLPKKTTGEPADANWASFGNGTLPSRQQFLLRKTKRHRVVTVAPFLLRR